MSRIGILFVTLMAPMAALGQMQVVSTSPTLNAIAATTTTVSVTFDRAVNTATVTPSTFRVSGQWSGAGDGAFSFSNGDKTVTVTPVKERATSMANRIASCRCAMHRAPARGCAPSGSGDPRSDRALNLQLRSERPA